MLKNTLKVFFVIALCIIMCGCSSTVVIPRERLQSEAIAALKEEIWNYKQAFFVSDEYDKENQIYDMYYNCTFESFRNITNSTGYVRARSFYDPNSKQWSDVKIYVVDGKQSLNIEALGKKLHTNNKSGVCIIEFVDVDESNSTVTFSIEAQHMPIEGTLGEKYKAITIPKQTMTVTYQRPQNVPVSYYDGTFFINLGKIGDYYFLLDMREEDIFIRDSHRYRFYLWINQTEFMQQNIDAMGGFNDSYIELFSDLLFTEW